MVSEEVADGELEQVRVVDRAPGEREPDLEAERAQRREPAHAESGAQRAADRLAVEAGEEELAAVQVDRRRPGRVEEVRVEIAELEQLPQAGDLERQAGGVAVAEQVVLRQLRLAEEALAAVNPNPSWKVPVSFS